MTTQKVIKVLRQLAAATSGIKKDALDTAIDILKRNIVIADIDSIIKSVSRETGVTEAEMVHKSRPREFTEARAMVSYLARRYTSMSLTSIGNRLGREYTSVMYYNRMVNGWLEEPRLNLRCARIVTKLINELEYDDKESE